jgi:Flp pilus assembly protein TadB
MPIEINFERLVSRGMSRMLSRMLDLSGIKTTVNELLEIGIIGFFVIFVGSSSVLILAKTISYFFAPIIGLALGAAYLFVIYMALKVRIDGRRTKMETLLPDYLQVASANLRSGVALDKALLLAARPEFSTLSEDVKEMSRQIMSGVTLEKALEELATRYDSTQLTHSVRMMVEAIKYGGAMADLLDQLSKDMRKQQIIQKEVAGQLLMYSIFIAFAAIIAAPVLYGLTSQMIGVTDKVWNGILASNPNGLPTVGLAFLKPSPPKITPQEYYYFSIGAIVLITSFAAVIMSAIASGSALRGIRYVPVFVVLGIVIFIVMKVVVGILFGAIGTV